MHKIHVHEGLVLGKRGIGEANTSVFIFTKELGLLRATARSARFEKSKLRYGLEPFSRGRFSFVRGKHEWKITGVEGVSREFLPSHTHGRRAVGRVSRLLLRLIHGEERGEKLYDAVIQGFEFFVQSESPLEVESAECIVVLRILSQLGYVPDTPALSPFIQRGTVMTGELAAQAATSRALLIRTINESLAVTGL